MFKGFNLFTVDSNSESFRYILKNTLPYHAYRYAVRISVTAIN